MKSNLHVLLNALLCISLATAGSGAQAEMLKPDSASTERDRVIAALQRPEIRARLAAQGVDAGEAEARVASLTDEEAALLASNFDELPAAGGGGDGLLVLVAFAAVVYVVIQLLPLILIGGGTVAAIKASNRGG
jgi:hypothetical protein